MFDNDVYYALYYGHGFKQCIGQPFRWQYELADVLCYIFALLKVKTFSNTKCFSRHGKIKSRSINQESFNKSRVCLSELTKHDEDMCFKTEKLI